MQKNQKKCQNGADNKKKTSSKSIVRRLVIANLVAALGLLTTAVVVLFCLGLLGSVFEFLF